MSFPLSGSNPNAYNPLSRTPEKKDVEQGINEHLNEIEKTENPNPNPNNNSVGSQNVEEAIKNIFKENVGGNSHGNSDSSNPSKKEFKNLYDTKSQEISNPNNKSTPNTKGNYDKNAYLNFEIVSFEGDDYNPKNKEKTLTAIPTGTQNKGLLTTEINTSQGLTKTSDNHSKNNSLNSDKKSTILYSERILPCNTESNLNEKGLPNYSLDEFTRIGQYMADSYQGEDFIYSILKGEKINNELKVLSNNNNKKIKIPFQMYSDINRMYIEVNGNPIYTDKTNKSTEDERIYKIADTINRDLGNDLSIEKLGCIFNQALISNFVEEMLVGRFDEHNNMIDPPLGLGSHFQFDKGGVVNECDYLMDEFADYDLTEKEKEVLKEKILKNSKIKSWVPIRGNIEKKKDGIVVLTYSTIFGFRSTVTPLTGINLYTKYSLEVTISNFDTFLNTDFKNSSSTFNKDLIKVKASVAPFIRGVKNIGQLYGEKISLKDRISRAAGWKFIILGLKFSRFKKNVNAIFANMKEKFKFSKRPSVKQN